jgi:hypothetical protein
MQYISSSCILIHATKYLYILRILSFWFCESYTNSANLSVSSESSGARACHRRTTLESYKRSHHALIISPFACMLLISFYWLICLWIWFCFVFLSFFYFIFFFKKIVYIVLISFNFNLFVHNFVRLHEAQLPSSFILQCHFVFLACTHALVLFIYVFIYFMYSFIYSFIYLFIHLFFQLFISYLCIDLFVFLFIHLFIIYLFIYLCIYVFICLFVYLFIYSFFIGIPFLVVLVIFSNLSA